MPETSLGVEDLEAIEIDEIISRTESKECHNYSQLFFELSSTYEEDGDKKRKELYLLLGCVTGVFMNLEDNECPFGKLEVGRHLRTLAIEDIEPYTAILKDITQKTTDAELKARLADLIWITQRDFFFAVMAIESYLDSFLNLFNPEEWVSCVDRLTRGIQLIAKTGFQEPHYSKAIALITTKLNELDGTDQLFLSERLMGLLIMLAKKEEIKEYANRYLPIADKMAKAAEENFEFHRARCYWEISIKWNKVLKNSSEEKQRLINLANTFYLEAEKEKKEPTPSYIKISRFLTQTIEGYRRVGKMTEKITELHKELLECQEKSMKELSSHAFKGPDISEMVERSMAMVSGKSLIKALEILAFACNPLSKEKLKKRVGNSLKDFQLTHLFGSVMLNDSGKIIARKPSFISSDPKEQEAVIQAEMYENAKMERHVYVLGIIMPALQTIYNEHVIRKEELYSIVEYNPFIPYNREAFYINSLYYGLIGKWDNVAHLLIPQLEDSIRKVLINIGEIVSTLDKGIQDEQNLNSLLYNEKLEELWGPDIMFELQGLLVERFGSNLRNRVAHGLMNYNEFYSSTDLIYLWWLTLRLCIMMKTAYIKSLESTI